MAPGAFVTAAQTLFLLAPDGPRQVRAELDEAFADRVGLHSTAMIAREFQPGPEVPARVARISDLLGTPTLAEDETPRPDSRAISVVLDLPPGTDLRLGQRVLVRFRP